MNQKHWQNIYHASVNVRFVVANVTQIKSGVIKYVNGSLKTIKVQKSYVLNPSTFVCENGKYLGSTIDDSVIRCDEIINAVGNVSTTYYYCVSKFL